MFKIIIVDDEDETRAGIIQSIKWTNLGLKIAGQAVDGIEGIQLAGETDPDIALLDVKMPKMNGIQCAREIRGMLPQCKIIFMSGYSEKEYLKSAIQMQAIDYVEKPLDILELTGVIKKTVEILKKDISKNEEESKLKSMAEVGTSVIRQELAIRLIHRKTRLAELKKEFKELMVDLPLNENFATVHIRLHVHRLGDSSNNFITCKSKIYNILNRTFNEFDEGFLMSILDAEHMIMHFYGYLASNSTLLKQYIKKIILELDMFFGGEGVATAGVGNSVRGVENVPVSYHSARASSQRLFLVGYGSVILPERGNEKKYHIDAEYINTFKSLLEDNDFEKALMVLNIIVGESKENGKYNIGEIKNVFLSLILAVLSYCRRAGSEKAGTNELTWADMLNSKTIDDVVEFITIRLVEASDNFDHTNGKSIKIKKAIEFIKDNYSRNISIEDVAEKVTLAPTYLCSIFKKEVGRTINQFIEEYRIKKAKQLLKNEDIKLSNISQMVGYSNAAYFISVFKKVTGISPSEYRKHR